MGFIDNLIKKVGKMGFILLLALCAIIVSLSVLHVINNGPIEQMADDLFKAETGVDLEDVEEKAISKK